jgi:WD40 repeat protein
VVSASKDGAVRIWDIRCSTPLASLASHAGSKLNLVI